jgi:ankyrin repeat protein
MPRNAFSGHQAITTPKATKMTLRGDDEESGGSNIQQAIRFNLGDGNDIYRGMKVKGVVEELSQDDLLLAVKAGSSHVVEALCTKYHLTNVSEIRGVQGQFELLRREVYDISNWNLLLIAIAYDHLVAIKLFSVTLKAHLRIALRTPPIASFSKVQESDPA